MVKIQGVSKSFREGLRGRKVQALQSLRLEVASGEVFGFLGPNGAGKLDRHQVSDRRVRQQVGYLPENPYFYDYLNADELLWFGGRSSGMTADDLRHKTPALLERVGLLEARKRPLRTYSKGMVQRAGLALALIHDPAVVILDEPMSGLDPVGRKMVGDLILDLKHQGKTVFFSSHILNDIERFCDRIGIIAGGRLRLVGELDKVVPDGETLEELFLRAIDDDFGGLPS